MAEDYERIDDQSHLLYVYMQSLKLERDRERLVYRISFVMMIDDDDDNNVIRVHVTHKRRKL